jgi:hypothetical protein
MGKTPAKRELPPNFDPIIQVWRRMGSCYVCLGIGILIFGGALLAYAMLDGKGNDIAHITKIAGGLMAVTSLQLFHMGRKRFERIGIVETVTLRWIDLASAGGSDSQLAELDKMITKLLKDNLAGAI